MIIRLLLLKTVVCVHTFAKNLKKFMIDRTTASLYFYTVSQKKFAPLNSL